MVGAGTVKEASSTDGVEADAGDGIRAMAWHAG